MASVFTKIINGEIPCHKLKENDKFISFLDINPINPGHTLVVPKLEVDYFFGLNDNLLSEILLFAKKLVPAIEASVTCQRVGLMVAGLDVPHAHLHLVPILSEGDLTFDRAQPAGQSELAGIANKIRNLSRTKKSQNPVSLDNVEPIVSRSNGPDQCIVSDEESQLLYKAMAKLPYEQKEAVILHIQGKMKFKDVAKLQDAPIKTTISRYNYGINKLRSMLDSEVEK